MVFGFFRRANRPAQSSKNARPVRPALEALEERTMPSLTVNLSAPPTALIGTDLNYIATVGNSGTSALTTVSLTDTMPRA